MSFKEKFINLYGKITGFYNYGKNNKIVFIKDGKKQKRIFMPKGLTVIFEGNNSNVEIELPIKFENALICLEDDNTEFKIKSGCKVREAKFYVDYNSAISIGKNCHLDQSGLVMIANCSYKETAKISLGDNIYIGRNCLIRTSDGHTMLDKTTRQAINPTKSVVIEDHVWITSNCTILKGSQIRNNSIVGACALVNKKFEEENVVIAGSPAKILKHNIDWDKRGYGTYMRKVGSFIEESLNGGINE